MRHETNTFPPPSGAEPGAHAWAMDAWSDLIFERQGLGGVATELAVLTVWAVALMAVATWRLHAVLTRP